MKLYVLPPSPRAFKVLALKNHLGLECELQIVNLARDDHLTPEYGSLNPNRKMPVLEDDGFLLWESNAILFYLASKKPESGLWPSNHKGQADVLRWLSWESAHWDSQAVGAVGFEKVSRMVLRLGPPEASHIARGEQEYLRFAEVLNGHLKGRKWLVDESLTIADFSIGAWIPMLEPLGLPVAPYPEMTRWYRELESLPGWQSALSAVAEARAQLAA